MKVSDLTTKSQVFGAISGWWELMNLNLINLQLRNKLSIYALWIMFILIDSVQPSLYAFENLFTIHIHSF